MRQQDVKVGHVYRLRIEGRDITVRIRGRKRHGIGWYATDLETGRQVVIKLARNLTADGTYMLCRWDGTGPDVPCGSYLAAQGAIPQDRIEEYYIIHPRTEGKPTC